MHETIVNGFKNRVLQHLAMSLPGGTRVRVPLHRLRGVKIGDGVWIGSDVMIETAHPSLVSIGNRVVIGVRSTILAHFQEVMGLEIGDDVYIGACATRLSGHRFTSSTPYSVARSFSATIAWRISQKLVCIIRRYLLSNRQ